MANTEISNAHAQTSDGSLSQWRAMVIEEVDEDRILEGYGGLDLVPTCLIQFPVQDLKEVAVLSWRWDGDLDSKGSMNIACAVHQAKRMSVKYLFLDVVSIDQNLLPDDLIRRVLAFAELYVSIPVIAAYDFIGQRTIADSLKRPWIAFEARKYRYNPGEITYIGHNDNGGAFQKCSDGDGNLLIHALDWASTGNIWLYTVHGVLTGDIGMTDIADFMYIIPTAYQYVMITAYEKMTRNDYLLTLLLLWGVGNRIEVSPMGNLCALDYSRYRFIRRPYSPGRGVLHYDIFLDDVLVASGRPLGDLCQLTTRKELHRVVFAAIGLHYPEQDECSLQTDMNLAWQGPPRPPNPRPKRVSFPSSFGNLKLPISSDLKLRGPPPSKNSSPKRVSVYRVERLDSTWHSACVACT